MLRVALCSGWRVLSEAEVASKSPICVESAFNKSGI
jgi:hypothetical protein